MKNQDIIGTGWSFPPSFNKRAGQIEMTSGIENIAQSLEIIVNTRFGERILRRDFGSGTHELIFNPINENIKTFMQSSLKESIEQNEPRIEILDLQITQPDPLKGIVDIALQFTVIATNETNNLVLPYHLPDA